MTLIRPARARIPNATNLLGDLNKTVDCTRILGRMDVTMNGRIEHGLVERIIGYLTVIVMNFSVPPVIS